MTDAEGWTNVVRVMLIKTEETAGILDVLRDQSAPPMIIDRGPYWLVEGHGEISIDVDDVGDRVGRELDVQDVLVNFTSYAGRVEVDDSTVRVTADFFPCLGPEQPAGGLSDNGR